MVDESICLLGCMMHGGQVWDAVSIISRIVEQTHSLSFSGVPANNIHTSAYYYWGTGK